MQFSTPMFVQTAPPTVPKRIVDPRFVEQAISKTAQPLVLDEDVKSSVLFYMERFVDKVS
jgi:hypothetical protein